MQTAGFQFAGNYTVRFFTFHINTLHYASVLARSTHTYGRLVFIDRYDRKFGDCAAYQTHRQSSAPISCNQASYCKKTTEMPLFVPFRAYKRSIFDRFCALTRIPCVLGALFYTRGLGGNISYLSGISLSHRCAGRSCDRICGLYPHQLCRCSHAASHSINKDKHLLVGRCFFR